MNVLKILPIISVLFSACASAKTPPNSPCLYLISGQINEEAARDLAAWAEGAKDCKVPIVGINSPGGYTHPGFAMMQTLAKYSVICVVTEQCHSMALIVLQGCKRRLATPNAALTFHAPTPVISTPEQLENTRAAMLAVLSRSSLSFDVLASWLLIPGTVVPMTSSMAKHFGLIDDIVGEKKANGDGK